MTSGGVRYAGSVGPAREFPVSDPSLIDAARRGDRPALERVLQENFGRIHGICKRIVGNDADADDATQEALLAVCRGIGRFDGRAAFSTWLYRVATNAALDELRRRGRRPIASADDELPLSATSDAYVDGVADQLLVESALAQLSIEFRTVIVLRDICQLDYDEIATTLSIPPGTVRSRIARGRGHLARILASSADGAAEDRNQQPSTERPSPRP